MRSPKQVSLAEIAARCGISTATVSNVLNQKGRVSERVRQKVLAVAQESGLTPNRAARMLRTGRSALVGLIVPDVNYPYFMRIAKMLQAELAANGYQILLASTSHNAEPTDEVVQALERSGVDGLIIVPSRGMHRIGATRPFVIIDSQLTPDVTVASDHRDGGRMVAQALLALGHRDFFVLSGDPKSYVHRDRILGIKEALAGKARQRYHASTGIEEERAGAAIQAAVLAAQADGATAFLGVNDMYALIALTTLQRAGIAVPQAASVAGFDDLDWARLIVPSLTTVRQDVQAVARIAVRRLLDRLDPEAPADAGCAPLVPVVYVKRDSVGPPPKPGPSQQETQP